MSSTTAKGQCLCGKVQVIVTAEKPLTSFSTLCCHCDSCKRRSGGVASYAFIIPKQHVTFNPNPEAKDSIHKTFEDNDTGSGKPMQRTMCTECGSPVCIIEGSSPDMRCLQYGLFAGEVDLPRPELEMFASKRVGWIGEVGRDVRETA